MAWYTLILLIPALTYALWMVTFADYWLRTPESQVRPLPEQPPLLSIIVAARNEAENLPGLLEALVQQDYPAGRLEIFIADDSSEDETPEILEQWKARGIQNLRLERDAALETSGFVAYKKRALAAAILLSKGDVILVTDADCHPPPTWASAMLTAMLTRGAKLVAGPVTFVPQPGLLQRFQTTDFLEMQGVTAALLYSGWAGMANGANLLFDRHTFEALGGYDGALHLASGDDMMLAEKFRRADPRSVAYCKDPRAIVPTIAPHTWRAFFRQRIRWASKNGQYGKSFLTLVLLVTYLFNVVLLAGFIAAFFLPRLWPVVAASLVLKVASEAALGAQVFSFFRRRDLLIWLVVLQPLHVVYIVASGAFGLVGGYEWKGRRVGR